MSKNIRTVVEDIHSLLENGEHQVNEDHLDAFLEQIKTVVKSCLETSSNESGKFFLRASNIGTPNRKLYLDSKSTEYQSHSPDTRMKFLYGDIIEALLILLIKEAGHEVTEEQETVELKGVPGHKDCRVDGVLVDIKSASGAGFSKFITGKLLNGDDPFAYRHQLSFYNESCTDDDEAGWIVLNKEDGRLCLLMADNLELPSAEHRIDEVREVLDGEELPPICYEPKKFDNGNVEIANSCKWCTHRDFCFPSLRVFKYASGLRYFTHIESVPRKEEVTKDVEE